MIKAQIYVRELARVNRSEKKKYMTLRDRSRRALITLNCARGGVQCYFPRFYRRYLVRSSSYTALWMSFTDC